MEMVTETKEKSKRVYWSEDGQICFIGSKVWGTELIEVEPIGKRRCWDSKPICLGEEGEIQAILKGEMSIPDDWHDRRKAVLNLILGDKANGRDEAASGTPGLQRSSNAGGSRDRAKDPRPLEAKQGLPSSKANNQRKGISVRRSAGLVKTAAQTTLR